MKRKLFFLAALAIIFASCHTNHSEEEQDGHDSHDEVHDQDVDEELKFQYTEYSANFELFAEADPFVVGETANVLSHFTNLPDFTALESGQVTIRLLVNGKEVSQTLDNPSRKGIYSFDIKPEVAGKGSLKFEITQGNETFEVVVPEVNVFATHGEAHQVEVDAISYANTAVFNKEQSWKIDFSTAYPSKERFGELIKTTARVQSTQGDERLVAAKTNGIVKFAANNLLEGITVSNGQVLFTISGSELADNNISVRYAEAQNNFEKAKADYERARELAKDQIVSEKSLLEAKNQYDNAKAIFDNLNTNFNASGQTVKSPMAGFIKQVFVSNRSYVEIGQPILTVSQNKSLVLSADVPQKYAPILATVQSASIRTLHDNQTYSLEQLNGKVLSYGKAANAENHLIPINLQINNNGSFIPGGFVEIYLKTWGGTQALTVPNSSLLEEQGNYAVFVQITPELFEKRIVSVGKSDGIKTEILGGLSEKERIVTEGTMLIKLAQATGTLDAHSGHVH